MKQLAVLMFCIGLGACNSGQEPVVESQTISVIYSSIQCPAASTTGVRVIRNDTELAAIWHDLHRMQLDGPRIPAVDFRNTYLVLINVGQKPTAGYILQADAPAYVLRDHVAVIRVQWLEPEPGSLQAQVITNPCLLLQVPKGDYTEIEIIDQRKRVLFRQTV